MLPLNQKQQLQYKVLRTVYLLALVGSIVLALANIGHVQREYKIMAGFGTVVCMGFVFLFKKFLFPPDLRGGMATVLGFAANIAIMVSVVPNAWLFSGLYAFYSIITILTVVFLLYFFALVSRRNVNLPFEPQEGTLMNKPYYLAACALIFSAFLVLTLYVFLGPFVEGIKSAPADQRLWIWIGFVLDTGQQVFMISKLVFAQGYQKEINERQAALLGDWNAWVNIIFLAGLVGLVAVMVLG